MPPKVKYSRDEMIAAALDMARESGVHSITARALGEKLGTSSRPVFTAFRNMLELQQEVKTAANQLYNSYIDAGLCNTPAFKGVGMQYIRFAKEEPKLFQLLFMSEQPNITDVTIVLPGIDENYERILSSIVAEYGLNKHSAQTLYRHLWIYTHGIAVLYATGTCTFEQEEISSMLTEVFTSLIKEIGANNHDD
ncbi:WHG domain-containing protein [Clostridia bacterium OttesenSCG-928-F22]|nr:WHG domain-containing protein [Clostridia bacterium OttesenSCG-928-F22]